jgi:hypothetical protein
MSALRSRRERATGRALEAGFQPVERRSAAAGVFDWQSDAATFILLKTISDDELEEKEPEYRYACVQPISIFHNAVPAARCVEQ